MKSNGTASDHPRERAAQRVQDEAEAGERRTAESTQTEALLSRVLERENLQRALKQVRQNKGAPGIDGMTVDALPDVSVHSSTFLTPIMLSVADSAPNTMPSAADSRRSAVSTGAA